MNVQIDATGSLTVSPGNTADVVTVEAWLSPTYRIEYLQFADGARWDAKEIAKQAGLANLTTAFTVTGTPNADLLLSAAGNDWLQAGAGNDELIAAGGNDTLLGEDGDDALFGEAGDDILIGGQGSDLLDGGPGADTLYRDGNDRIVFRAGDGQDHTG